MTLKATIIALSALTLFATGGLLVAGPLNPPAGPVTGTYKTLSEVEPRIAINAVNTPGDADSVFRITQPGSYYLTGNITGVVGKHGIEIVASGVTLDLNGFHLVGVPGMGLFDGVSATVANLSDIEVRNGSVRSWGDVGIDLGTFNAFNCIVRDVRSNGNAGSGIFAGSGCTISGCTAYNNGGNGISTGNGCTISACTAYANTANGISPSGGCTISACLAYSNTGNGISTGAGCTIIGCTARTNTVDGIRVTSSCIVLSNTCSSNGNVGDGAGIHATGSDNRIEGNNCISADRGIDVDISGNIIIRNTCSGNTTNWDIAANNIYGPIIDRTAPASAAVLGNGAAGTLASTDPNANFTY